MDLNVKAKTINLLEENRVSLISFLGPRKYSSQKKKLKIDFKIKSNKTRFLFKYSELQTQFFPFSLSII